MAQGNESRVGPRIRSRASGQGVWSIKKLRFNDLAYIAYPFLSGVVSVVDGHGGHRIAYISSHILGSYRHNAYLA
jgi:hypothetical protein